MNITVTKYDDVLVLKPETEYLDVSNAPGFREQVKAQLGSTPVAVDMSHVKFVDSAALGAFISCLREATAKGVPIKLFGLTPPVRATIQLVRLHRVLHILTDLVEVRLALGLAAPRPATPVSVDVRS